MRLSALALFTIAWLFGADPDAATQAVGRLERQTGNLSRSVAADFRMLAAQSLHKSHPELAARLVAQTIAQLRESNDMKPGRETVRILAELAPREAPSALPLESRADLVSAYLRAKKVPEAVIVFRELLGKSAAPLARGGPLIGQLARDNQADAKKLFAEILAAVPPGTAAPIDAWGLIECAGAIASIAPADAAAAAETIVKAAADPEYGKGAKVEFVARFGADHPTVTAADTRESVLIGAGAVLARTAPARLSEYKSVLGKWDLAPLRPLAISHRVAGAQPQPAAAADSAISQRMREFRGLPTDAARAKLALALVADIEKLDPAARYGPASSLSHLITEGDMGKTAVTAVARTYGNALLDAKERASIGDWTHLASLIRYERLSAPVTDPMLDAATALLEVRESIHQDVRFTLTALDGKTYSLEALRGKVVLLNFWATWCPPCRKELPDLDKLYREFGKQGFVVLAISDEGRATVEGFLAKQTYTFPVLLDPDRKVHSAFDVEGIPKNFLFGRDGKLVGQTIDMRTEAQFREMLARAGLK
jgi:peroxiredoxin